MNSLLELHNIYYSYHTLDAETRALSDLSFSVQPGTFTAVVGPSGCGKSTLLSLICGLMKPDAGEILLNGIPLKENPPLIGYMLQHDHLLDWRSIYRNVTLGPEICGTLNTATKKRAYELLEQYGLKQFASARPSQPALLVTHDLSEAISLSDRVIVLTNRPAKVRCEIPIFFKLEQDTPLNRRNAPEFKHYFNQIWKELNHDN